MRFIAEFIYSVCTLFDVDYPIFSQLKYPLFLF